MKESPYRLSRLTQIRNSLYLRRAAWFRRPTAIKNMPEPWSIGQHERGKQLVSGHFLFKGQEIDFRNGSIWDQFAMSDLLEAELHGFKWLDDLLAFGNKEARELAQIWLIGWISKFGMGKGIGWNANLTGRRLIHWINHLSFIESSFSKKNLDIFYHSLALQMLFLSKYWPQTNTCIGRFEALCGLVYATSLSTGMERLAALSLSLLNKECETQINSDGTLAARNPEEILNVFALLIRVKLTLESVNSKIPQPLLSRIENMAPVLRGLRHGNGTLPRFHGGGSSAEYFLDQVLASSGIRPAPPRNSIMGFARLSSGSTTLIVDAAPPYSGPLSLNSHASTNALELSVSRNLLFVNCGSGSGFGDDFHLAGRCTASHSTMTIEGVNSSWFSKGIHKNLSYIQEAPKIVKVHKQKAMDVLRLRINHDGYQSSHGLTHVRTMDLAIDGNSLVGEDELYPPKKRDLKQFDKIRTDQLAQLEYAVQFHIHPDVQSSIIDEGTAISLTLVDGDCWVLKHDGSSVVSLEDSVYFDDNFLDPRPTSQIVLSGKIKKFTTRVRWSLAKVV